uniref:Uncharacterized protein n=1 Tax=Poecilia formosa TaxID=48698 RepID=A0A096LUR8_POEFO
MRLITELAERLNSLIKEFATTNFAELASDIKEIFNENEPPTLTQHHLNDPEFIKLWYQIKLLPLLPDVNPDLLSCLSTKNFSCPVYQTLVAALGESMRQMDADMMYSHNIYRYFIYSFLNHTTTGPQCISSANQSAEWVKLNFGFFSSFASVIDFYQLNPDFSALEALPVLTPKQLAEMLLLPLPGPTEKDTIIHAVFDFLLESPEKMSNSAIIRSMEAKIWTVAHSVLSVGMIPSAEAILDVIEEIRLSALTDGELTNSSVIHLWFAERLSSFLPFASGRFLLCLTSKNLSCPSYQQILQVFVGHFEKMPFQQQLVVLKDFILRFLLNAHSNQGCLSSFNNSAQWLTDNFGPFSEFVLISELIHLNRLFKPVRLRLLKTD